MTVNIAKLWHQESGMTAVRMGDWIGLDYRQMSNIIQRPNNPKEPYFSKIKHIRHMQHLIRCEPADVLLLKYELAQYLGIEVEDL